ncbi:YbaB/EbfC family nucleoid-associated protein [Eubacterium aggregans]|uniref:YbaB/EbfC family nucleoid-associated protein n=1 Tax=Eubacterium aggregans TaxID=81409 RepID=UPI003F33FA91
MAKTKRRAPRGMDGPKPAGKNDMMKQIQKMQEEMARTQEALEETEIDGSAGGGAVKVLVKGSKLLSSVSIDPDVIDEDDVEMLEDLIVAAVNDALAKVDELTGNEMGKLTGGMNIPGLS